MHELLVKPKEKYDITHKDTPVQEKSYSRYEPLGYTQCGSAKSRQEHYLLKEPKSMETVSENSLSDGGVIQMWKLMDQSYGKTTNFIWKANTKNLVYNNINNAIASARGKLANFMNAVNQTQNETLKSLAQYAQEVYDILGDDNLEIYPMQGASFGQAGETERAISMNVVKVREDTKGVQTTKTLIHEAFHIAGGGWDGKETDCTSEDPKKMLHELQGDKRKINADTFAQFIMRFS